MSQPLTRTNKWLRDPKLRREMMIRSIISTQAVEGITTTYEQAAAAYDKVQEEKHARERHRGSVAEKVRHRH